MKIVCELSSGALCSQRDANGEPTRRLMPPFVPDVEAAVQVEAHHLVALGRQETLDDAADLHAVAHMQYARSTTHGHDERADIDCPLIAPGS